MAGMPLVVSLNKNRLDSSTVHETMTAVRKAASGALLVVLHFDCLLAIDETGMAALARYAAHLWDFGGGLSVAAPEGPVLERLRAWGAAAVPGYSAFPTVREAVAALVVPRRGPEPPNAASR
jgi:hypothetical protein